MTTLLGQSRPSAYQLTNDLRGEAIPAAFRTAAPSEAEREEMVLKKLGLKCWGRLHHFRNYYSQGWGEGVGKPLSPRALEAFYRFLKAAKFSTGRRPSLFLTDNGNLELCWEDDRGKAVQVEFTPAGVEFFIETENREGVLPHSGLIELARLLAA